MEHPLVVVCVDGCQFEYITAAVAAGVRAVPGASSRRARHRFAGRLRRAELHQPQQPVHRHRARRRQCTASAATTSSTRERRRGSDDERPALPARGHHPRGASPTPAPRSPWSPPRTSCASCSATSMRGICFSAEKADEATLTRTASTTWWSSSACRCPRCTARSCRNSCSRPASSCWRRDRPDLMYLSTTDYVQHKAAPGTPAANAFYAMMDRYLARARRARRDHRAHRRPRHERQARRDGQPERHLPAGRARRAGSAPTRRASSCRSPIPTWCTTARSARSRPSTCRATSTQRTLAAAHRGTAGHRDGADARPRRPAASSCRPTASATSSSSRERNTVLGTSRERHDLSGLDVPLRSHGGVSEQEVPLFVQPRRSNGLAGNARWRNFDAFDLALNLAAMSCHGIAMRRRMPKRERGDPRESLRIAGESVARDARASRSPTRTPASVSAPCRRPRVDDVRARLRASRATTEPTLTRHERYQILMRAGEIVAARTRRDRPPDHARSRACAGRTRCTKSAARRDVLLFAANQALVDDGQVFSCDLTPHGKSPQGLHAARAAAGRHHRDHAVQSSAEPGDPQGGARDRDQQPHGAQAEREDAADRAFCSPTSSTKPACRRRCCRS